MEIGSWLLVMTVVGVCQFAAAGLWEKLLWKDKSLRWDTYLIIGVLWGGLGVAMFNIKAIVTIDPQLMSWLLQTRLLIVYLAVAIAVAIWVAYRTVNTDSHSFGVRLTNSFVVATFMTFSYPALKYLQQGVWLIYSDHILAFGFYMVSFSAVIAMTTLTLGYSNLPEFKVDGTRARWLKHPRTAYTIACLALDTVWVLLQIALMRQHPADPGDVLSAVTVEAFRFGPTTPHFISFVGMAALLYVMAVAGYNRVQGIRVQDALTWKNTVSAWPAKNRVVMQNTELVKRALGMTNVGVVTWRAPLLAGGHGSESLHAGTTFISPGAIHDATLVSLSSDVALPDFWKAAIHPDDYPACMQGIDKLLAGPANHFAGQCRFRAANGGWLNIKGEIVVERSPVNGLPLALYGVHTDITAESQDNRLLGATKDRQQNALRMIGHDLQGSLSAVVMSTALLERYLAGESNAKVTKTVNGIKTAAQKAIDYLGDAVTYARTENAEGAGEQVAVEIRPLLVEVIEREVMRYGASPDKVVLDCPEHAVIESVRLFPLTAVLGNLISNAIKYTPDAAGKVRVSVQALTSLTAKVGGCTRIEVADEGVGIPPGFARQLFQAFSRADNVEQIKGTGLGLAIVSNALELLQATVSIQSMPERPVGTSFTLILPNTLQARGPSVEAVPSRTDTRSS